MHIGIVRTCILVRPQEPQNGLWLNLACTLRHCSPLQICNFEFLAVGNSPADARTYELEMTLAPLPNCSNLRKHINHVNSRNRGNHNSYNDNVLILMTRTYTQMPWCKERLRKLCALSCGLRLSVLDCRLMLEVLRQADHDDKQYSLTRESIQYYGTAHPQHVIAGFRGSRYAQNKSGTVGNDVFYWVRSGAI
jgi:hypothetical protein